MDYRSVAWLYLLPPQSGLVVGQSPAAFSELLDPVMPTGPQDGSSYVGWRSTRRDVPDPTRFESIALMRPQGISAPMLERAGFRHLRRFTALPSIDDTRWLIPLDNNRVSASGLGLIDPWKFRDRFKKRLLTAISRTGQLQRCGDQILLARRSGSELENALEESTGCSPIFLAMKTGPPRTMRKTTIQLMREDGTKLAYAKLATSADGRWVVGREIDRLRGLSRHSDLQGAIPTVLGTIDNPRYFTSILSAGPEQKGPPVFGGVQQSFLEAIAEATSHQMRFADSAMWRDMSSKFDKLEPQLSTSWRARLVTSMRIIRDVLGPVELSMSVAHRDFGPWNTRTNADGSLFVFDWDGAHDEMTPLYDLFGFLFLEYRTIAHDDAIDRTPERIFEACRQWAPAMDSRLIPYLFLAYLTESALGRLIGAMRRSNVDTEPILNAISRLLDVQGEWLPSAPIRIGAS